MSLINVIGLGYIGLPTALALAAAGNQVVGTDYNESLVNQLKDGKVTFEENGLEELFSKAISNKISFTNQYITTDIYIISVPTPYEKDNKKVDASYVVKAVSQVLEVCENNTIIIIESTISPGTINKSIRPIVNEHKLKTGKTIELVHAPERILPGNMIYELEHNSRVIGADSKEIGDKVKSIYATFCKSEIIITDIRIAEMSKVVENTYRDINIAFANELAKICRSDGLDVYEIIRIANRHPRVNILQPGPGVGGHCISVDPWFLVGDYPDIVNIILTARRINDSMPEFVLKRLSEIMEENKICDISKIGFYGLTYKEDVDDVRESPTLQILDSMKRHLSSGVKVYDPYVKEDIVRNQMHDFRDFIEAVDLVVILVGHEEIKNNMDMLKDKIIFDTRNLCSDGCVYKL